MEEKSCQTPQVITSYLAVSVVYIVNYSHILIYIHINSIHKKNIPYVVSIFIHCHDLSGTWNYYLCSLTCKKMWTDHMLEVHYLYKIFIFNTHNVEDLQNYCLCQCVHIRHVCIKGYIWTKWQQIILLMMKSLPAILTRTCSCLITGWWLWAPWWQMMRHNISTQEDARNDQVHDLGTLNISVGFLCIMWLSLAHTSYKCHTV